MESSDSALLKTYSDKVTEMLKGINGLTNVTSDLGDDKDMLQVTVDGHAAAENGYTQATVGQAVARAVRGSLIGTLAKGDTTLNVYLRSQAPVKNIEELRKIELPPTALMNGNAKQDAADEVGRQSDALQKDAKDAFDLGLIKSADVKGIYDLKLLNEVLKAKGEPAVKS